MKKLVSVFLFAFLIFISKVSATEYSLKFSKLPQTQKIGMVAQYDDEGNLIFGKACEVFEDKDFLKIVVDMESQSRDIRIYFPDTNTIVSEFLKIEQLKEEVDSLPYPKEIDKITSFMMLKSISTELVDDEVKIFMKTFFNGQEITIIADEEMTIKSAPIRNESLIGLSIAQLKKGDIIYCTSNIGGELRSVELIYRPIEEDITLSNEIFGENFENVFAYGEKVTSAYPTEFLKYGDNEEFRRFYAFGIIKEYEAAKYITLINKEGLFEKEISLDVNKDVIVYVYDADKREKVCIGNEFDVLSSYIYAGDRDEYDNVISWSENSICNYALLRGGKGEVWEIAVFLNCNK